MLGAERLDGRGAGNRAVGARGQRDLDADGNVAGGTLPPIVVMAWAEGPMNTRPAAATASAKSGFSDRKP